MRHAGSGPSMKTEFNTASYFKNAEGKYKKRRCFYGSPFWRGHATCWGDCILKIPEITAISRISKNFIAGFLCNGPGLHALRYPIGHPSFPGLHFFMHRSCRSGWAILMSGSAITENRGYNTETSRSDDLSFTRHLRPHNPTYDKECKLLSCPYEGCPAPNPFKKRPCPLRSTSYPL